MRILLRAAAVALGFMISPHSWEAALAQNAPGRADYEAAAGYSARHDGLALVVSQDGQIVFEDYRKGTGPDDALPLASGTKAFWCAAYAAGVADGLFTADTPVVEELQEWASDPLKREITVGELLNLTSGLDIGFEELRQGEREDIYALALQIPSRSRPGEEFLYAPSHMTAFGAFLSRRLNGESPLAYLERRVLDPVGLDVGRWRTDLAGNPGMAAGAFLTAREWLKYGQLLAGGGVWSGRQILPEAALADCRKGSRANPMFGFGFWLNSGIDPAIASRQYNPVRPDDVVDGHIAPNAPRDLFLAIGARNQRLYVLPSLDIVAVRYGKQDGTWRDHEFLDLLLGN